ncbi:hypothetical protein Tco_0677092 [Tanacetum coccineum]
MVLWQSGVGLSSKVGEDLDREVAYVLLNCSPSSLLRATKDNVEVEYAVPTGRVKVLAGRYVFPTGKDNVIVSIGRSNVIPAGRTILVQ